MKTKGTPSKETRKRGIRMVGLEVMKQKPMVKEGPNSHARAFIFLG